MTPTTDVKAREGEAHFPYRCKCSYKPCRKMLWKLAKANERLEGAALLGLQTVESLVQERDSLRQQLANAEASCGEKHTALVCIINDLDTGLTPVRAIRETARRALSPLGELWHSPSEYEALEKKCAAMLQLAQTWLDMGLISSLKFASMREALGASDYIRKADAQAAMVEKVRPLVDTLDAVTEKLEIMLDIDGRPDGEISDLIAKARGQVDHARKEGWCE